MPDDVVVAVAPDVRFGPVSAVDDTEASGLAEPLFRPPRSTTL